jgi:hypothetical protein
MITDYCTVLYWHNQKLHCFLQYLQKKNEENKNHRFLLSRSVGIYFFRLISFFPNSRSNQVGLNFMFAHKYFWPFSSSDRNWEKKSKIY